MDSDKRILVCVTQQKTCERLIKEGSRLRDELGGELYIIHVAMNGLNFLGNSKEGDALEYLFGISKSVGAELTVLRSDNIIKTITGFARDNKISDMILGEPPDNSRNSEIINELRRKLPNTDIYVMPSAKNQR
jgi:Osmosensitive K+ channel histidine kinase